MKRDTNSTYHRLRDENKELRDRVTELERKISLGTFPTETEEVIEIKEKIPKSLYDFCTDNGKKGFITGLEDIRGHLEGSELVVKNGDHMEIKMTLPRIVKEHIIAPLYLKDKAKRNYYNESAIGIIRGLKQVAMEWKIEGCKNNNGE